jgi:hypothetical protein
MAVIALAAAAPAHAFTNFRTPSKLIYCAYGKGPSYLRCDTWYRTRFSGTKSCVEGYYGEAFGMNKRGAAQPLCVSDSVYDAHARVLRYGTTRRFGPFTCTSRRTGLTCRNRSGHGWTLSRQKQRRA